MWQHLIVGDVRTQQLDFIYFVQSRGMSSVARDGLTSRAEPGQKRSVVATTIIVSAQAIAATRSLQRLEEE